MTATHQDRDHSRLSASSAYRWMACPGSVYMSEQVPDAPSSIYADQGTAAHQLAEQCLAKKQQALVYKDSVIHVGKREFVVDDDMADAVQVYLDEVNSIVDSIDKDKCIMAVEQRFNLKWIHPDMFGTNDFCCADTGAGVLYILDYKHGKGHAVEAAGNPQLRIYALGALGPDDHGIVTVDMGIVQPRAPHADGPVRSEELSVQELRAWAMDVLKPAAEKADKDNGQTLCVGDHCKFCPALAVCPKQMEDAFAVAKTAFSPVPVLPDVRRLPLADLAMVLQVAKRFAAWEAAAEAYAQELAEKGTRIPGHKLVAKRSVRKWTDEKAAEAAIVSMVGEAAYAPRKLLSPTQTEALFKDNGYTVDLSDYITKPDNGVVLVPDSDKRKEVVPSTLAALAFSQDLDLLK